MLKLCALFFGLVSATHLLDHPSDIDRIISAVFGVGCALLAALDVVSDLLEKLVKLQEESAKRQMDVTSLE